ncbi:rhomboid family intramembrane serine protease [Caloramator sp. E03]|uniref:rhomboid family intramembrane serine protease n=1 Tax=Caloramator sp. E03 TaxID=2576307 RepID=UPI001110571D|nr:rhomboid family intramembrane serine protease [Caloramator sp. E03]QCX32902.1 rhomboid family intramembrane serine protease [Caloramator sp. E03]
MSWIDKLERKFNKYAIPNLMLYIVSITGFVYLVSYFLDQSGTFLDKLTLYPDAIIRGEVWRLITYIFIPPASSPIFIIFILYFYYIIGISLEHEWGSFRFNLYYLLGMAGTTIAALITGYATYVYLNLSLFLAFAYIYPNFEMLLFFIIPVKVKYLAYFEWIFIIITLVTQPIPYKAAAIASLINYFIFFGKDIFESSRNKNIAYNNKTKFKSKMDIKPLSHKCTVCGITPEDDPNMEFRYCSECEGLKCYCMNHIKNHEHIKS